MDLIPLQIVSFNYFPWFSWHNESAVRHENDFCHRAILLVSFCPFIKILMELFSRMGK